MARRIKPASGRPGGGKGKRAAPLPTAAEILAYIAEHPGKAGKREIARAFGVSGGDRIALKKLLSELAQTGEVEKRGKRLARPGALPGVSVLLIEGRDSDGELLGIPAALEDDRNPPPKIVVSGPTRGRVPGVGDRVLARLAPAGPDAGADYVARVIKILDRKSITVLGVVREMPDGARIEPVDRKQPILLVAPHDLKEAKEGDLVSVESIPGARFGPKRARVVERIGSMRDEKAVSLIALVEHGIPHVFPDAVIAESEKARPANLDHREDWRKLPLVTLDPADAKDHDDAVHAEPDQNPANPDGWIVHVAIADVSFYVRPETALDREARKRGNSVYFPDRVVPMLPERLSNELCSLTPGDDRPALAVRMVFGSDGRKRSHTFHRITMRSAAKLAYGEAQAAFDGRPADEHGKLASRTLAPLWQAYQCLLRGRDERGPLELDLPERKVLLKKDGTIDRIVVPERLESHRLIEEFMIQANVAAAETLEERKSPLVYRIHDAPSLAKLEALRDFLASIELTFPHRGNLRPNHFNTILKKANETEHASLLHEVVLRSQSQAEYSPANIGHFGLNLRRYAHFTSPIRRYADLVVHRALVRTLKLGPGGLPDGAETELETIAAEISASERRAMAAERDTIDRLVAHWLADRVGATFSGRIAGVTRAGLFVKLDQTGADGFVPIRTLGEDYFVHDEVRHALIGRQSGTMHRLGDEVDVRLIEAAPLAGALRFELLSEGRLATPRDRNIGKSRHGGPPRGRDKAPRGKGRERGRRR